jgi:pimeloyl-ACP methyl ester carboxylesterase
MPVLRRVGASISYSKTGTGPPVLLIQGVGVIGEGWRPQVDGLSHAFSLITFDNRGIGASTRTAGRPLSIEDMAADALAILDAEEIGRCHVVGHSMGGLIAQHVALVAPHRVESLALLCTFPYGKCATRVTPRMLVRALRMRVGTRKMRRRAFLELVMSRTFLRTAPRARLAERLRPLFGHDLAEQPRIVVEQLRAMARYDMRDRLRELQSVRTLVLSAAQDRIAPAHYGRALAAAIPGAKYVELAVRGTVWQFTRELCSSLARSAAMRRELVMSS